MEVAVPETGLRPSSFSDKELSTDLLEFRKEKARPGRTGAGFLMMGGVRLQPRFTAKALKACMTGISSSTLMLRCRGVLLTQWMTLAMSSALIGVMPS